MKSSLVREYSEGALQQAIIEAATLHGYLSYHTHDSRQSQAGELDLHLVTRTIPSRALHVELKGYDSHGRLGQLTPEQWEWLYWLQQGLSEAYLWTPEDWLDGSILKILTERSPTGFVLDRDIDQA